MSDSSNLFHKTELLALATKTGSRSIVAKIVKTLTPPALRTDGNTEMEPIENVKKSTFKLTAQKICSSSGFVNSSRLVAEKVESGRDNLIIAPRRTQREVYILTGQNVA